MYASSSSSCRDLGINVGSSFVFFEEALETEFLSVFLELKGCFGCLVSSFSDRATPLEGPDSGVVTWLLEFLSNFCFFLWGDSACSCTAGRLAPCGWPPVKYSAFRCFLP